MVTRIAPSKPVRHFLKEWRLERRLTQQQLADLLPTGEDGKPTGKDQISRWERSERGMTMGVQAALAEALGITPVDLFRHPAAAPKDSIDRMLEQLPKDWADDLHDEFERRVLHTQKLIEATQKTAR